MLFLSNFLPKRAKIMSKNVLGNARSHVAPSGQSIGFTAGILPPTSGWS